MANAAAWPSLQRAVDQAIDEGLDLRRAAASPPSRLMRMISWASMVVSKRSWPVLGAAAAAQHRLDVVEQAAGADAKALRLSGRRAEVVRRHSAR